MIEQTLITLPQSYQELPTPLALSNELPAAPRTFLQIQRYRNQIRSIMLGQSPRLIAVVGPCSIHDPVAGLEYAARLQKLSQQVEDKILIVMRYYFEKPRTTVGWKGLISDPHLNNSRDLRTGLAMARKFLVDVADMGMPIACEFLDPNVSRYISDLVSWVAIGARTTESQIHRELASGLNIPVGFKNSTQGIVQVAVDALVSSAEPHSFLTINKEGIMVSTTTDGNKFCHIILRGGNGKPNYSPSDIADASQKLGAKGCPRGIMVDCSHDNSQKDQNNQKLVLNSVIDQYASGTNVINGFMLESNLVAGKQSLKPGCALVYGQSITDGCISWDETEDLLLNAYNRL